MMDSLLASDVYPGTPLRSGSRGDNVRKMQSYLNVIGGAYPSIPQQTADSISGSKTQQAVTAFQRQFGLTADGVIGVNTWNKIVSVYREVSGAPQDPDQYPGSVIDYGASGPNVVKMQNYLNEVGVYYPTIPRLTVDGRYGNRGQNAVTAFQKQFGLAQDGVIGEATWNRIVSERARVKNNPPAVTPAAYPGVVLQMGSQGSSVVVAQNYLNYLASRMPQLPTVSVDGVYGTSTQTSVIGFQKKYGLPQDGKIGPVTWKKIAQVYADTVNNQLPPIGGDSDEYPGAPLRAGSRGDNVTKMQTYLNFIGLYYTSIPATAADGVFGTSTDRAGRAFQQQFGLPVDGIIGENTWNKIVEVYGELQTNPQPGDPDAYPGTPLQMGSRGGNVAKMQNRLNFIGRYYTSVPAMAEDGIFGSATQRSVQDFQREFGLTVDGIIGEDTWYKILDVYNDLQDNPPPQPDPDAYPGTPLRAGSRGDDVTKMQTSLNFIGLYYTSIPQIGVDGSFGTDTDRSTRAFQGQFGLTVDGIIGERTWNRIIEVYNELQGDPQEPDRYPGTPLEMGSSGANVTKMQSDLNSIGYYYPTIPRLTVDGRFGDLMYKAVTAFQRQFRLPVDGIIGEETWDAIVAERTAVTNLSLIHIL